MALDPAPIAKLAAEFIDDLLEDTDYDGGSSFVRIAVAVEVDTGGDKNYVHVKGHDLTAGTDGYIGPTERVGFMFRALLASIDD